MARSLNSEAYTSCMDLSSCSSPRTLRKVSCWPANEASGRSSAVAEERTATANSEDLPEASFAGQQETFLNVRGEEQLLKSMHEVYASLFNDRAISYRVHNKFDHSAVALSVGVQHMVRSDLGSADRKSVV